MTAQRKLFDGTIFERMDGRVELVCIHGIGHPSKRLQTLLGRKEWSKYDGIHGCDGCCSTKDFEDAEEEAYIEMFHRLQGRRDRGTDTSGE